MRYIRLFFLYAQDLFEYRSLAFVWFLVNLVTPLLFLLFWRGAVLENSGVTFRDQSDVTSYYLLYLVLNGFLIAHIEHEVAWWDIKEGGLVKYILKPLPYFLFKFFLEFTWRITIGVLSLCAAWLITIYFDHTFFVSLNSFQLLLAVISCVLAYFISFIFKMIIGFSAFWVIDFHGIEQLVFVIMLIFSGYIIPLNMFPIYLRNIADFLPIAYMIYYPIMLIQGKLSNSEGLTIVSIQCLWLILLSGIYIYVWNRGVKKFTGVGQ